MAGTHADDTFMKALVTAAATALAVVLTGAGVSASAYPPVTRSVTASPSSGAPGYEITVTASCDPDESVRIQLGDTTVVAECREMDDPDLLDVDGAPSGRATAMVEAPASPGSYRGTAAGTISDDLGGFVVQVDHVVVADASLTQPADTVGIDWNQVFRYSTIGGMFVAFFAVVLVLRRRHEYA